MTTRFTQSLRVLSQAAVDDKPFKRYGSFADDRVLIVALTIGEDGTNMRTRFMAKNGSAIPHKVKQRMADIGAIPSCREVAAREAEELIGSRPTARVGETTVAA